MRLQDKLFSLKGRLNRSSFIWLYLVLTWLSSSCERVVDKQAARKGIEDPFVLFIIAMLPLLWIQIAITVKRFQDCNRSGWFTLTNILPLVSILLLIDPSEPSAFTPIIVPLLMVWLVSSGYLIFVKGTDGPNDYGLDFYHQKAASYQLGFPSQMAESKEVRTCPKCQHDKVPIGARYCFKCGTALLPSQQTSG